MLGKEATDIINIDVNQAKPNQTKPDDSWTLASASRKPENRFCEISNQNQMVSFRLQRR
jgi:hypothetical protein